MEKNVNILVDFFMEGILFVGGVVKGYLLFGVKNEFLVRVCFEKNFIEL